MIFPDRRGKVVIEADPVILENMIKLLNSNRITDDTGAVYTFTLKQYRAGYVDIHITTSRAGGQGAGDIAAAAGGRGANV